MMTETTLDLYHFALKVFNDGSRTICDNERDAFRDLREHNGMVRYLGGYSHRAMLAEAREGSRSKGRYTHNILLEFGDRDLDLLFADKLPPVLQDDIQAFWQNLFAVADAVKGVHRFEINNDGIIKEYSGWHADIKPDNILEIRGQFKLADPGFAKLLTMDKSDSAPTANLSGGTHTRSRTLSENRGAVNQTTDIWSLGCVFSIAATWVILGAEGIKQYQRLRLKAIATLIQTQTLQSSPGTGQLKLNRGDYFHDGFKVLPEISSSVLDLIDTGMLVGDSKQRMTSIKLCEQLKAITKSLEIPSINVSKSILDFLRDGDDTTLSTESFGQSNKTITPEMPNSGLAPNERQVRDDKFFEFLDAPLMANYRSYPKPPSIRPSFISDIPQPPIQRQTDPEPSQTALQYARTFPAQLARPESVMTSATGMTGMTGATRNRHKKRQPQDVFQAREEIEIKELERKRPCVASCHLDPNQRTLFIVDNAESMSEHWGRAKFLLETLLLVADGLDDDGVDLIFTRGAVKAEGFKDKAEKIMKKMNDPKARPRQGVYTAMQTTLQHVFDEYIAKQPEHGSKLKERAIIVLTDGLWDDTSRQGDVARTIVSFAQRLEKILGRSPNDRLVSIEFIQFGNDLEATFQLRRLDNELKNEGIPDLVDTEHCNGDVNKMLLGSFNEAYDAVDDFEEPESPLSPSRQSSYGGYEQFQGAGRGQYPTAMPPPRSSTMQTQPVPRYFSDHTGRDARPSGSSSHRPFNSR
ncbi:uncharacterized protein PAC_04416 [Phialocephala subalpina]|uniref:Protein kinase domain-containing protein n=1 Tax=Phialocephala subalpina TaxID=576137 RepID=A0A1L7WP40_9HELO|nr:uncharacterized protein PAC_04416 [Phialocephala subalpina]